MKTANLSAPSAAAATPSSSSRREKPSHQEIAERARALWNGYGCPSGRDEQIWLEAERQLIGTDSEAGIVRSSRTSAETTAPKTGGGRRVVRNDEEELAIAGQGADARGGRRRTA